MSSKIVFIGIHYKPGKQALDSTTPSGRKIDGVISFLNLPATKCNLFQGTKIPKGKEADIEKSVFKRLIPDEGVLVLLGNDVQKHFPYESFCTAKILKFRHPAFSPASYSMDLAILIRQIIINP